MEITAGHEKNIAEIIHEALIKLGRVDMLNAHLDYLKSEWYYSLADLRLAIDDEHAWSDIKLPGRLKLEIKRIVLRETKMSNEAITLDIHSPGSIISPKRHLWVKCFSPSDNCSYYYHPSSGKTQWEEPAGENYVSEEEYLASGHNLDIVDNKSIEPKALSFDERPTLTKRGEDVPNPRNSDDVESNINSSAPLLDLLTSTDDSPSSNAGGNIPRALPLLAPSAHTPLDGDPLAVIAVGISDPPISLTTNDAESTSSASNGRSKPKPIANNASRWLNMAIGRRNDSAERANEMHARARPAPPDYYEFSRVPPAQSTLDHNEVDITLVQRLSEMGFPEDVCIKALKRYNNDLTSAAAYLVSPRPASD